MTSTCSIYHVILLSIHAMLLLCMWMSKLGHVVNLSRFSQKILHCKDFPRKILHCKVNMWGVYVKILTSIFTIWLELLNINMFYVNKLELKSWKLYQIDNELKCSEYWWYWPTKLTLLTLNLLAGLPVLEAQLNLRYITVFMRC